MNHSEHYNMNMPQASDQYDIRHWNDNTAILDRELYREYTERVNSYNTLNTKIETETSDRISGVESAKDLSNATGILSVSKGGTGKNTYLDSINALLSSINTGSPISTDNIILQFGESSKKATLSTLSDLLYNLMLERLNMVIPTGIIFPFGGINAPNGYFLCDGRELSRSEYSNLFSVIGVKFGGGDGVHTFNIPDYRGRTLEGVTNDIGVKHESGLPVLPNIVSSGSHSHTYTGGIENAGSHTHTVAIYLPESIFEHRKLVGSNDGFDSEHKVDEDLGINSSGDHTHNFNLSINESGQHSHTYAEDSIYGASNKVQAPSVETNFIIKY